MLRKRRCADCGQVFYGDGKATSCQNCSGSAPDLTKQLDDKAEIVRKANTPATTEKSQTLDIKKLADSTAKAKKATKNASS